MGDSSVALRRLLDSLEACRSSLHFWMTSFTWLVVVGVAAEIVFVIWQYLDDRQAFRRGIIRPPDKPSKRKLVLEIVGVVLVAFGIAGELYTESKIAVVETELENANARHIAEMQFELRTSIARSFHGYRAVDPFAFDDALRHKPRGHVTVWANIDDPEAHGLGLQLWIMLRAAGWDAGKTIQRLPPESASEWISFEVYCHPWDMVQNRYFSDPHTAVEAFLKALTKGTEAGSAMWVTPDNKLADDTCLIKVHPQTPMEIKINKQREKLWDDLRQPKAVDGK